jgi:hypothetical protein
MITMSETERSFIAFLQPGQSICFRDRDGEARAVQRDPADLPSWLHLFHHDTGIGIVSAWFGTPTRLMQNILPADRYPIGLALEDLILQPGPVALIRWEKRARIPASGLPYGGPVWIPVDHTLIAIGSEPAQVPQ